MNDQGHVISGAESSVPLSSSTSKSSVSPRTAVFVEPQSIAKLPKPCSNLPKVFKARAIRESVSFEKESHTDATTVSNIANDRVKIQCDETGQRQSDENTKRKSVKGLSKTIYSEEVSSKMGNQHSGKAVQSDDDTPDESKTKCCEIPKKKLRDRNSKISRSSRTDDNDFTEEEVYPFESRSRSDHELNEPVELEPFEIIETDEIKFVAGAGTSEVIRNASESKFKSIPEEGDVFDVEQEYDIDEDQTEVKQPISLEQGVPESGTTTAHSTFEFKQTKAKNKIKKTTCEMPYTGYDNVVPSLEEVDERFSEDTSIKSESTQKFCKSGNESTPRSSKSGSSSSDQSDCSKKSSKDSSRKNSKEAIPKPARKSKPRKHSESDKVTVVIGERLEETGENIITVPARSQSKGTVDEDRKNDNVIILTQTMFSKPKKPDKETQLVSETAENNDDQTKYENVNVGVKFEPNIGISIGHKSELPKTVVQDSYENVNVCAKFNSNAGISIGHSEQVILSCDASKEENIFHAIDGASAHHMSLAERSQLVKEQFLRDEKAMQESKKNAVPVFKQPANASSSHRTMDMPAEIKRQPKNDDVGDDYKLSVSNDTLSEYVPPPSPTAMDILLEEDEEEEEYDEDEDEVEDDVLDEEERRKSAEIVEFTEHVCKRLSQLLDIMSESEDSSDAETNDDANVEGVHIYENTCDIQVVPQHEKDVKRGYESSETILADESDICKKSDEPLCHRLIGNEIGKLKKANERFDNNGGSSGDDLPEYFDPRKSQKRDSKVLCDVVDAYTDDVNEESAQNIVQISGASQLNIDTPDFRVGKNKEGKDHPIIGVSNPNDKHTNKLTICEHTAGRPIMDNGFKKSKQTRDFCKADDFPVEYLEHAGDKLESLKLWDPHTCSLGDLPKKSKLEDLYDTTPTTEAHAQLEFTAVMQTVKMDEEEVPIQFDTYGRRSVTYTESDLDISEHRDDLSTDSMLADDEDEETMDILFTKTYTEPVQGSEVFLSCTVVNSAYKEPPQKPKSETWLSDEALEYLEANAADVMSTAFMKARKEMKDIQICIQSLREQMEHFHGGCDDIRLPNIPVDSLSPDYFGLPRKAVTD